MNDKEMSKLNSEYEEGLPDQPELKDYLHLYLGCEVYIFPPETASDGWLKEKLISIPDLGYKYKLTADNLRKTISNGYVIILRKLDSMTEEEQKELDETKLFQRTTPVHVIGSMVWTAESFRWALSKHFDLFGLIEKGLAIDKNKTP